MYLDNNNHFYGKIGGKSIRDFLKFNYKLDTCEERIEHLQEVLGMYEVDGVEFYDEYFDEVYDQDRKYGKINIVIGKDKSQYSESNIASTLEKLADYILAVDEKDDDVNYKIYTSEELFNRACKEFNLINKVARVNGGSSMIKDSFDDGGNKEPLVFPIFQLPKNYNKVKDLKFEKKDLEKYPQMKDYYDFYEYLKTESKKLWNTKGLSYEQIMKRGLMKKVMPEIKKDMMLVKEKIQRPIIWKSPLKPTGCPDYDELDMFDRNTIKELLRVHKGNDLQDDLTCIIYDLQNLIDKIEFTDKQQKILNMWSSGMSLEEIANLTHTSSDAIGKMMNTIANRIVKEYEEEYTYWYYLNIRKGTYKKCSKCGEIKLISQFDKNGKKGLKSMCKRCRK